MANYGVMRFTIVSTDDGTEMHAEEWSLDGEPLVRIVVRKAGQEVAVWDLPPAEARRFGLDVQRVAGRAKRRRGL